MYRYAVETAGVRNLQDLSLRGDLLTAQTASGRQGGVNSTQALVWNVGTCAAM
jgi:hypothetical protein